MTVSVSTTINNLYSTWLISLAVVICSMLLWSSSCMLLCVNKDESEYDNELDRCLVETNKSLIYLQIVIAEQ